MRTKNHKPNAEQKRWHDDVAQLGCVISGDQAEIDHLIGASAKQDGISIGQWCVAPLSPYWHRLGPSNRTFNRSVMREGLVGRIGQGVKRNLELELFLWTCANYCSYYHRVLPFGNDVLSAILIYCRVH